MGCDGMCRGEYQEAPSVVSNREHPVIQANAGKLVGASLTESRVSNLLLLKPSYETGFW
jgi:hypothetical protein